MTNVKNILIIGRTGSGKSALGNVLINKNNNFEEVFKENNSVKNETRDIESEEVDIKGIRYHVIDTIGIGNNDLTSEEIAHNIIKACFEFKEGLNRILLVIRGRIILEEIKFYNIIMKRIFDDRDISKYTTIVRTNFYSFLDREKCDKDYKLLKKENRKISKLMKLCSNVIYIDNPSLNLKYFDKEEIIVNKRRREKSRNILLTHLATCCQDFYQPSNLELIVKAFGNVGPKDELVEFLKGEIEKLKSKGFFRDNVKNLKKQLLREKIKTEEEAVNSSLQASIEMRNICRQM